MSSRPCLLRYLFLCNFDVGIISSFVSAASDVDPGNVTGQRAAKPAVVDENAAEQTAHEQPEEQPAVVTVAETAEENPAQVKTRASTLTRDYEAARTPPPSSVVEEGEKVPTPPLAEEERAPTPVPAEASTPKGSPSRGKGPLIPVTTAGVARRARRRRQPPMTKWRGSRGAPMMVANMFSCGASVGTTGPVTRSSPRPRRRRG